MKTQTKEIWLRDYSLCRQNAYERGCIKPMHKYYLLHQKIRQTKTHTKEIAIKWTQYEYNDADKQRILYEYYNSNP